MCSSTRRECVRASFERKAPNAIFERDERDRGKRSQNVLRAFSKHQPKERKKIRTDLRVLSIERAFEPFELCEGSLVGAGSPGQ